MEKFKIVHCDEEQVSVIQCFPFVLKIPHLHYLQSLFPSEIMPPRVFPANEEEETKKPRASERKWVPLSLRDVARIFQRGGGGGGGHCVKHYRHGVFATEYYKLFA